jgi:hypothetical protein
MNVLEIPVPRYHVKETGTLLQITVPSRKLWFQMIFISIWLLFWLVGLLGVGGTMAAELMSTSSQNGFFPPILFMLAWLTFWTIGGSFALVWLLWQLFGEEIIEATCNTLTIKRRIFGLGQTKTFNSYHIKELHVTPIIHSHAHWGRHKQWHTLFEGPLTFDYGAQTFHYANGASEAEARQIIALLKPYLKQ